MNILVDDSFSNWTEVVDGTGTTALSNGNLLATAPTGERAYRTNSHACDAGEDYTLVCQARLLNEPVGLPVAGMFVDHPTIPSGENRVFFDSTEWKTYELPFTVPATHRRNSDKVVFGVGSWTATDGGCEVTKPRIISKRMAPMTQSLWGQALLEIRTDGTLEIINSVNIVTAEWRPNHNGAESNLFLSFGGIPDSLNVAPSPRAFITTTAPASYIAKAPSTITGGTGGQFNVKILDTATGQYLQTNPSGTTRIQIEVVY